MSALNTWLAGVRVLDLSQYLPGPLATLLLADFGDVAPKYFDPPVADTTGSLFAVIAILGALRSAERSGRGCAIDVGLADVVMPLQIFQVADYGARSHAPGRNETYLNGGAAYYQVYATSDARHVALGAIEDKFWRRFCETAGRAHWIARGGDALPQRALIAEVAGFFAQLSLAECVARFAQADCCFTPVANLSEALESPQCRSRELVRRAPAGDLQPLFPAWIDGEPPAIRPPLREIEGGFATRTSTDAS